MRHGYAKKCIIDMDELIDQRKDNLNQEGDLTEDQRDAIQEYLSGTIKADSKKMFWEWQSKDVFIHWET